MLEGSFRDVTVEGEISNFLDHRSGHRYFTLKDSESQISATLWKSRPVNFKIKDGIKVVCRGRIAVYGPRGTYNLDVQQIRPVGIGELQKAYEALYARLATEGLFAESRKRPIPRFPVHIGIVTSESGAALQDILTVLRRRYPVVSVTLRPATVQGLGAELDVARGIQQFNLLPPDRRPDVLIVGRGGGSLEDLWSFNEEAVARAIFGSEIPVISAVGHEVDFTIADFVADLRAPTPTAAAELATPDVAELYDILGGLRRGMQRTLQHYLNNLKRDLRSTADPATLKAGMLRALRDREQVVDRAAQSVRRSVDHRLERFKLVLSRDEAKIAAMNPYSVLERGYAILETPEGKILPRLDSLLESGEKSGVAVFSDGRITVRFD